MNTRAPLPSDHSSPRHHCPQQPRQAWCLLVWTALVLTGHSAWTQTWQQTGAPTNLWGSMAASADGSRLVALVAGSPYAKVIYTSKDAGASWTSNSVPAVAWWSVASSADGNRLVAAASYGGSGIFTSADAGATWVSNSLPAAAWFAVASSADGLKLAAVAGGGQLLGPVYTTTNAGATWVSNSLPAEHWQALVSTANWVPVTNPPALSLPDLQYQVDLFPSNASGFYRLASPAP